MAHPFHIPSALNSHLLCSLRSCLAFALCTILFFLWYFCAKCSTLFAIQNHFRSADGVAGAVAAILFFFFQMNIYLLHAFWLWFWKHPKIFCNAIQPGGFFLVCIALTSKCTEQNTRKILIYISLFFLFSAFYAPFFPLHRMNVGFLFEEKKNYLCSILSDFFFVSIVIVRQREIASQPQ